MPRRKKRGSSRSRSRTPEAMRSVAGSSSRRSSKSTVVRKGGVVMTRQEHVGVVRCVLSSVGIVGLELTEPCGHCDGLYKGVRYFTSRPNHASFVRTKEISRQIAPEELLCRVVLLREQRHQCELKEKAVSWERDQLAAKFSLAQEQLQQFQCQFQEAMKEIHTLRQVLEKREAGASMEVRISAVEKSAEDIRRSFADRMQSPALMDPRMSVRTTGTLLDALALPLPGPSQMASPLETLSEATRITNEQELEFASESESSETSSSSVSTSTSLTSISKPASRHLKLTKLQFVQSDDVKVAEPRADELDKRKQLVRMKTEPSLPKVTSAPILKAKVVMVTASAETSPEPMDSAAKLQFASVLVKTRSAPKSESSPKYRRSPKSGRSPKYESSPKSSSGSALKPGSFTSKFGPIKLDSPTLRRIRRRRLQEKKERREREPARGTRVRVVRSYGSGDELATAAALATSDSRRGLYTSFRSSKRSTERPQ